MGNKGSEQMRIDQSVTGKHDKYIKNEPKNLSEIGSKSQGTIEKGALVKGVIEDIKGSRVRITLDNQHTIEARLTGSSQFHIGQEVTLMVKESSVEQIVLTPVVEMEGSLTGQLERMLNQLNMKPTEDNIVLIKTLLAENMPVSKEMIQQVSRATLRYPETPLKDLLLMIKNDIPLTQVNINQLSEFISGKPLFFNEMQSTLNQVVNQLVSSENTVASPLNDFASPVVSQVSDILNLNLTDQGLLVATDKILTLINGQMTTMTQKETTNPIAPDVQQVAAEPSTTGTNTSAINEGLQALTKAMETVSLSTFTNQEGAIKDQAVTQQQVSVELPRTLTSEQGITALTNLLGIPKEEVTVSNLADVMTRFIHDTHVNLETLEVLKESILKPMILEVLERNTMLSFEALQSNITVKAYFDQLSSQMTELSNRIFETSDKSLLKEDGTAVKSSLEFVRSLNQNYQFLELPMFINDQIQKGALYVFGKKKNQLEGKEAVSALLQLDMVKLGHLDVYMNKDKNNVDIKFFTENEGAKRVVESTISSLSSAITDKGFHVTGVSVALSKDPFDVREDFLEQSKGDKSIQLTHIAFDMRI